LTIDEIRNERKFNRGVGERCSVGEVKLEVGERGWKDVWVGVETG
jgi:hypothetical protein